LVCDAPDRPPICTSNLQAAQTRNRLSRSFGQVDEARAVLARLERIEALEREGAGTPSLLAELRELVREASAWAERERDHRAWEAAAALAEAERRGGPDGREALLPSASARGPIE
jgi:hypothetical protein